MADDFDPYYKWLAIPPDDQPPNHYRLLGLSPFESEAELIGIAADQRMAHLRTFQIGKHSSLSQRLLNEVSAARVCLLNPTKKAAYDQQLHARSQPAAPVAPPPGPYMPPPGLYAPPAFVPPVAAAPAMGPPAMWPAPLPAPQDQVVGENYDEHYPETMTLDGPSTLGPDGLMSADGHRSRRRNQTSLGVLLPIIGGGLAAAIALVVYSNSNQPVSTKSTAARDGQTHSEKHAAPASKHPVIESYSDAEPPAEEQSPPDERVAAIDSVSEPDAPAKTSTTTSPAGEPPNSALITPTVRQMLRHVARQVSAGWLEQSEAAGGSGGEAFEEVPLEGALLVGLQVATGDVAGEQVLRGVQAIYLSEQGIIVGEPHGDLGEDPIRVQASPGFAVGAMNVYAADRVEGVKLVYSRIQASRLEQRLGRSSDLVGDDASGPPVLISGEGRPVVGIFGAIGSALSRFGLMLIAPPEPAGPGEQMPAKSPSEPDKANERPLPVEPKPMRPPLGPQQRLPVPTAEAQKEVETLIHSLFKQEYADASAGSQQRMALAVKLFRKAEESADDPTARYVLLAEARDLAARCGDSLAVADAIMLLAANYEIDDVSMTLVSFEKAAEATTAPLPFRRKLVENCILLIDRAVAQEKFDVAERLLGIGRRSATKAQDNILSQRISWRAGRLREQKAAHDAIQEAIEILKTQPDNPQANLTVGRYRTLYQENWAAGLPLLAAGSDPALRAVAEQELAERSLPDAGTTDARLKLAEAWEALAKRDESLAPYYGRRARLWYSKALVGLRGINKVKVAKKLDELWEGRGLKAEFFRGDKLEVQDRQLTRIDANIDFNWKNASPAPEVPADNFSVRWTGLLAGPAKGEYQLTVEHDDGVRIWLDNKLLIDRWDTHGSDSAMLALAGKARLLRVELREGTGSAKCVLKWAQKGGFAEQVIPPEAFWQEQASGSKTFAPLANSPYAEPPAGG